MIFDLGLALLKPEIATLSTTTIVAGLLAPKLAPVVNQLHDLIRPKAKVVYKLFPIVDAALVQYPQLLNSLSESRRNGLKLAATVVAKAATESQMDLKPKDIEFAVRFILNRFDAVQLYQPEAPKLNGLQQGLLDNVAARLEEVIR